MVLSSRGPVPSPDAVREQRARATESPAGHKARATSASVHHSLQVMTAPGKPVERVGARPLPRPDPGVTAPRHTPTPPGALLPPGSHHTRPGPALQVRNGPSLKGVQRATQAPGTQERKQPCGAGPAGPHTPRLQGPADPAQDGTAAQETQGLCRAGWDPLTLPRGEEHPPGALALLPKPLAPGQPGCTYLGQLFSCYS